MDKTPAAISALDQALALLQASYSVEGFEKVQLEQLLVQARQSLLNSDPSSRNEC
ncbi:MAG TPA: hypothetical protein VEB03_01330 [Candidatus Nanoarchaeia archaeon]|nr:hypothetical protein [Candidatus Nanoarchaeia archaeon]